MGFLIWSRASDKRSSGLNKQSSCPNTDDENKKSCESWNSKLPQAFFHVYNSAAPDALSWILLIGASVGVVLATDLLLPRSIDTDFLDLTRSSAWSSNRGGMGVIKILASELIVDVVKL